MATTATAINGAITTERNKKLRSSWALVKDASRLSTNPSPSFAILRISNKVCYAVPLLANRASTRDRLSSHVLVVLMSREINVLPAYSFGVESGGRSRLNFGIRIGGSHSLTAKVFQLKRIASKRSKSVTAIEAAAASRTGWS